MAMTEQQSVDLTRKAIAQAIIGQKAAIIASMKRNGIIVSPSVSDRDLAIMIFEGMNRSRAFQRDLSGILYTQTQMPDFLNQTGEELTTIPADKRQAWTQVAALGLDTGLKLLGNRINQKQADRDRLAAIQYNASEVERLKAELELKQAQPAKAGPSTLTYVILGAVAVAAIAVVVVVARRKK